MMINQSPKYPKDGPKLNQAETLKYQKHFLDFLKIKVDLTVTNEILTSMSENKLIDAMSLARLNYMRSNSFEINANNYRKVARDACRVSALGCISAINRILIEKQNDKQSIIRLLKTVHQISMMLDPNDAHIARYVRNLELTMQYGGAELEKLGLEKDFELILNSVRAH